MTAKAHRATRPAASARAGTAVLDRPPAAASQHEHLLQLQREAGNEAVCQLLSVQRKAPPKKAKKARGEFEDVAEFLDGFQQLAVAATTKGARAAYGPKFSSDLSADRRAVLERVRRVLIKAQGDKSARKAAMAEWPRLVAQLMAGVEAGRTAGISDRYLSVAKDNIESVGEHYVKAKDNRPDAAVKGDTESEFAIGVQALVGIIDQKWYDLTSGVVPLDMKQVNAQQQAALRAVKFGEGLNPRHKTLLEQLRQALIHARTRGNGKQAVALWKQVGSDVLVTLDPKIHSHLKDKLADIGQKLIVGGLYNEKHNAALDQTTLANPKEGIDENSVKAATKELIVAKDIADKAIALGTGASMGAFFKAAGMSDDLGGAIWDLAQNPGEIGGKLADFKKMGLLSRSATAADLADKVLALRNAVYTVSLNSIKHVAEREGQKALAKGAADMVAKWKDVGDWATKHLKVLEKVGRAAIVVGIAVSIVKVADAIERGDYAAAFQEAINAGLQAGAAVAGGMAGGALFAGIGVIIAAEMEGIAGAAAMIRWAKEENVKTAALGFIHICEDAAKIEVRAMLADMKLLGDPDLADQQADIQKRLVGHLEWWNRHVARMRKQYESDRVTALGGQPALRGAMGPFAQAALFADTPDTWEGLGNNIKLVFAGANSMSKYVAKTYGAKG